MLQSTLHLTRYSYICYLQSLNTLIIVIQYQQRRVRHISSFQVRNLTPFPVRDAAASALARPQALNLPPTLQGRASDDLDGTFTRKRARKISASSVNTLGSHRSNEESWGDEPVGTPFERRKRDSISSINSITSSPSINGHMKPRRPRAISKTFKPSASTGLSVASPLVEHAAESTSTNSFFPPTHSQIELEHVIGRRLLETFITVTLKPTLSSPSTPHPWDHRKTPLAVSQTQSEIAPTQPLHKRVNPHAGFPSPHQDNSIQPLSLTISQESLSSTPDFVSRIHRPSTNPKFEVEPIADFSNPNALSEQSVYVELWAKQPESQIGDLPTRKGKERQISSTEGDWKVLETWNVHLSQLIAIPEEVRKRFSAFDWRSNSIYIKRKNPWNLSVWSILWS